MRKRRHRCAGSRDRPRPTQPTPPLPTPPDTPTPPAPKGPPRLPSTRVAAALAAGMLALGVAVGAAIGPAPETSLAGERIPLLLPAIAALAGGGGTHTTSTSTAAVQPPPVTPQPTPAASSASAGRRAPRHEDLEGGAERRGDTGSSTERRQAADQEHSEERRAGHAPARHERVADHALRQQLRAGARADGRRPLHRLPARPRRHVARRLVLARRQLLRERGRATLRRTPADARLDRPAPVPRRRRRRRLRARNRGRAERGRRIPESHPPRDHRQRRLPRARPSRDHVRLGRQRHGVEPARRRLDRDAQLHAPRGRAAALAVRPRRRAADERLSTQLHPSRASPGCCTDPTPQPAFPHFPYTHTHTVHTTAVLKPTKEIHVARNQSSPPQAGHVVARRARGLHPRAGARRPGGKPRGRIEPEQLLVPRRHRPRDARSGQRRTAGGVRLLLQRPDHRLPAAGADPADRRPEPAARDRRRQRAGRSDGQSR